MTRPKKYQKSIKQIIKEASKNPTDQEILFYRTSLLPNTKLIKDVKEIHHE